MESRCHLLYVAYVHPQAFQLYRILPRSIWLFGLLTGFSIIWGLLFVGYPAPIRSFTVVVRLTTAEPGSVPRVEGGKEHWLRDDLSVTSFASLVTDSLTHSLIQPCSWWSVSLVSSVKATVSHYVVSSYDHCQMVFNVTRRGDDVMYQRSMNPIHRWP